MKFMPVELDGTQKVIWDKTKTALVWGAPAFTHLFYQMLNPRKDDGVLFWSAECPTMATDGRAIIASPEFFFKLDLKEAVFGLCHEICHGMLGHCDHLAKMARERGKVKVYYKGQWCNLEYSPMLANIAQDFVINDMLVASGIGRIKGPTVTWDEILAGTKKAGWLHDPKRFTHEMTWVDVYAELYQDMPPPPPKKGRGKGKPCEDGEGGEGEGEGNSQSKFDKGVQNKVGKAGESAQFDGHLTPGSVENKGEEPVEAPAERAQQWEQAVAAAYEIARARGDMPGALKKFMEKLLEPVVDWSEEIRAWFARKSGSGSMDFRRADRQLIVRDIYAPSKSGYGCGTIIVAIDTSGSVFAVAELLERWFAEISGIMVDLKPRQIIVIECDAQVQDVAYLDDESDLQVYRAKPSSGGGGTDFRPVFEWIAEQDLEIDALVYLTDMWGTFPYEAPDYETIWGSITPEGQYTAPTFGKVVHIPANNV